MRPEVFGETLQVGLDGGSGQTVASIAALQETTMAWSLFVSFDPRDAEDGPPGGPQPSRDRPAALPGQADRTLRAVDSPVPPPENDRALAAMLGIAALVGAGMWGALFMVLF